MQYKCDCACSYRRDCSSCCGQATDTDAAAAWPEHNEIASRLAHESTVLLQNDKPKNAAAPALPLDAKSVKTIAVVGPNADAPRFGDYTGAEHHRGGNIVRQNHHFEVDGFRSCF